MTKFPDLQTEAVEGLPVVTRRRALVGIVGLAAGSTIATPAIAEMPVDRLERLTNELSQALVEWTNGQFMAVIYPANHPQHPSRVEFRNCRLPARQRRDYHLAQFMQAAEEIDPAIEDWQVALGENTTNDCSILIAAYRFTGSYDGDGTYEAARATTLGHPIRYQVRLLDKRQDGHRAFELRTDMDRMVLLEPRFNNFIGRKVAS